MTWNAKGRTELYRALSLDRAGAVREDEVAEFMAAARPRADAPVPLTAEQIKAATKPIVSADPVADLAAFRAEQGKGPPKPPAGTE